jgi:hypothetical protein
VLALAIPRSIVSKFAQWNDLMRLLNSLFYQFSLCVFQLWQCAPVGKFSRPTCLQYGRRWLKTGLRAHTAAEWRESGGTGGSHANSRAYHRGGHSENTCSQIPSTKISGNWIIYIVGLELGLLISRTLVYKNYLYTFLNLRLPERFFEVFFICVPYCLGLPE